MKDEKVKFGLTREKREDKNLKNFKITIGEGVACRESSIEEERERGSGRGRGAGGELEMEKDRKRDKVQEREWEREMLKRMGELERVGMRETERERD